MIEDINWFQAFFDISEGVNWFIAAYVLALWKWIPNSLKIIGVYLVLMPLFVAINHSTWIFFEQNTRFLHHIRVPIDLIIFGAFYYTIINNLKVKRLVLFLIVAFSLFCVVDAAYIESFWTSMPDITNTVFNVLIVNLSFYYFYEIYKTTQIVHLHKYPVFLFVLSEFFFSSSTIIISATSNFNNYDIDLKNLMYTITCVFWIIKSSLIFYSLRLIYLENTSSVSNDLKSLN